MGAQQDKVARVFEAAVELETPAERAAYLDAACGQDQQLVGPCFEPEVVQKKIGR
jgi:hypothetical protein